MTEGVEGVSSAPSVTSGVSCHLVRAPAFIAVDVTDAQKGVRRDPLLSGSGFDNPEVAGTHPLVIPRAEASWSRYCQAIMQLQDQLRITEGSTSAQRRNPGDSVHLHGVGSNRRFCEDACRGNYLWNSRNEAKPGADALKAVVASVRLREVPQAMDRFEAARRQARLAMFVLASGEGTSTSELGRQIGVSRQLTSRLATRPRRRSPS